jgi:hypothetical protein
MTQWMLVGIALLVLTSLCPAAPPSKADDSLTERAESLRQRYRVQLMPRDSPELELFRELASRAVQSDEFIQELINLTGIGLEQPPTTEPIGALDISPAAAELLRLNGKARPLIEKALANPAVSEAQKAILKEVIYYAEMRERRLRDRFSKEAPRPRFRDLSGRYRQPPLRGGALPGP